MDVEGVNGRLETIVKEINSESNLKKSWAYVKAIYVGGVLPEKYQREFAEKIGWSSRKLTTWNAGLMGSLTTVEYFFIMQFGGEVKSFIPEQIANTFHITYQASLYFYIAFNACQNLFRLGYAQIKNKGIASFSPMAGIIDVGYFAWRFLRKSP